MKIPMGIYYFNEQLLWTNKTFYTDLRNTIFYFNGTGIAITIGQPNTAGALKGGRVAGLTLARLNPPIPDAAASGSTGLLMVNVSHWNIDQLEIDAFNVGLAMTTDNPLGLSYCNSVSHKQMYSNNTQLLITGVGCTTSDFTGGDWMCMTGDLTEIMIRNNGGGCTFDKMTMQANDIGTRWLDIGSGCNGLLFRGKYFEGKGPPTNYGGAIVINTGVSYCRFDTYSWSNCAITNSGMNNLFLSNTGESSYK